MKGFEKAKIHYDKFGMGDWFEFILHESRHEAKIEEAVRFLKKFLMMIH
ncbi:hypothetical protein G5B00_07605 [Parapedobacter sp. SGR-10]|nr:hypothetical protein [Parapedobacter sp. SGR-10]NGF56380.1 hypothetical protein [Parapedobacter sp. SGR-10]